MWTTAFGAKRPHLAPNTAAASLAPKYKYKTPILSSHYYVFVVSFYVVSITFRALSVFGHIAAEANLMGTALMPHIGRSDFSIPTFPHHAVGARDD